MKPKATIAVGLILTLVAGPVLAQAPPATQGQQSPPPQSTPKPTPTPTATPKPTPTPRTSAPAASISAERLDRIREAINREPSLRIEDGQLKIYVEVIGHWPSFAEYAKG